MVIIKMFQWFGSMLIRTLEDLQVLAHGAWCPNFQKGFKAVLDMEEIILFQEGFNQNSKAPFWL